MKCTKAYTEGGGQKPPNLSEHTFGMTPYNRIPDFHMSMIVSSKLVILKTVSRITQNKSVMKVISNEKKFEFFEFELSEPECFGSVSQSLITELFPPTHKNVYINMAFINSKTLDVKFKILDEEKKRKLSFKNEEFKIGRTHASNIVKNEAKLREEFEKFKRKVLNILK